MNDPSSTGHDEEVTALPLAMALAPDGTDEGSPEDHLVTALRTGDRDAIEQAYVAHHQAVRGFARRLVGDDPTAEDIVHDTFVKLAGAMRGYRGDGPLRSFLLGIAVNCSRRHIRSAMRRRRAMERAAIEHEHHDHSGPDASVALAQRRLATALWAALDKLPHDQRSVFVLCEVEQRTSVEVSSIVGAPEGTVRTRLFHAKRKLRELLEAER